MTDIHLDEKYNDFSTPPKFPAPPGFPFYLISELIEVLKKNFNYPDMKIPDTFINRIFIASRLLSHQEFTAKFHDAMNRAVYQAESPNGVFRSMHRDLYTEKVRQEYFAYNSEPDMAKYCSPEELKSLIQKLSASTPQRAQTANKGYKTRGPEHISTILPRTYVPPEVYWGEKQKRSPKPTPKKKKKFKSNRRETWKSHPSEKKLWRSSKASFDHLLYRAQVPKDPDKFPWCRVGKKSLTKYTGYKHTQLTEALKQLEHHKRIKRIVEGNQFQGASKYLVFFTPEMSRAFSWKTAHRKNY